MLYFGPINRDCIAQATHLNLYEDDLGEGSRRNTKHINVPLTKELTPKTTHGEHALYPYVLEKVHTNQGIVGWKRPPFGGCIRVKLKDTPSLQLAIT